MTLGISLLEALHIKDLGIINSTRKNASDVLESGTLVALDNWMNWGRIGRSIFLTVKSKE